MALSFEKEKWEKYAEKIKLKQNTKSIRLV